jgi:hypothetical protein
VTATHLAAIRERDASAAVTWFKVPALGACGRAFIDRRWLLSEVDRLTAELTAAQVAPLAEGFFGEGP